MFDEQVAWAAEAGVDFVIAETFQFAGEALLATEAVLAAGLDAVVTLAIHQAPETREGWSPAEACRRLADAGATVVGLNCIRGPRTMLPLLEEIRAAVDVPIAALPVPYRTHPHEPTFQSLHDPVAPGRAFPTGLDPTSPPSRATRSHSGWTTSASAAGRRPTTSGRWPRRWAVARRRASTRPTCPSTPTWAPTPPCSPRTSRSQPGCRRCAASPTPSSARAGSGAPRPTG